jgi:hypothetical protein
MNDVGRYRKLYARMWRHPGFTALSEGEKVLALYLVTGPQTNRIGLYVLSVATAAEDLGTVPQTLSKRLVNVCQTFGWLFDKRSRVFYIPSWFKWNPPENVNVMKGSLKDLNEIPPCGLVEAFARNTETVPETLRETFVEGLRQRLSKGMPNQEQYQDQEAVSEAGTGAGSAFGGSAARSSSLSPKSETKKGTEGKLIAVAREVLQLDNPRASMDHLVDAFRSIHQGSYTNAEARDALNVALSERRVS